MDAIVDEVLDRMVELTDTRGTCVGHDHQVRQMMECQSEEITCSSILIRMSSSEASPRSWPVDRLEMFDGHIAVSNTSF